MKSIFLSCVACLCSLGVVMAQTTLSGDHVITGDLDVGATGALGGLQVSGQTGNSAAPGIRVTGDGGVVFEGNYGSGQIPASGLGTRFMWYPKKAAFRAGVVSDYPYWDDERIADYSFAYGLDVVSKGEASVAFGIRGQAFSWCSFVVGYEATVLAECGVATGTGTVVTGAYGFAGGSTCNAGYASFAYGNYSSAVGRASVAVGDTNFASGDGAAVFGIGNAAAGDYSMAAGYMTFAQARSSVAIGQANVAEGDSENALPTDPVFTIGNGTGNFSDPLDICFRNAFVVRRSGDVELTAKVKMPRQGDILMGEFGNPE